MATRTLNVQITGDARGINRVLDDTERRTKGWGKSMARGFAVAGAAAAGGLAVGLTKAAKAAIEAENSQARLETQLKAMNISYRAHARQIDEVIQKHSNLSGFDDEVLADSFTNIVRVTGDVDKSLRLTGLAADFARAKHMDVAKAGELIGKVAGGNIGILSRYGITLKDGATSADALATLQQKFAGQAEAYGKTTAGALDRAGVASENLGEIVGAKLTPILAKGAHALVALVDTSGQLAGPIRTATGSVRQAYNATANAVQRFARDNREELETVRRAMRNLATAVKFVFDEVIRPTVRAAIRALGPILDGFKQTLGGLVRFVSNILTGQWGKAWDAAKDTVRGVFRTLGAIVKGAMSTLGTLMASLAKVMIKGLVAGLKGLGTAVKNAVVSGVKAGVGAAKGAVSDVIGAINPFGDGIGRLAKKVGDGVGRNLQIPSGGAFGGSLMGADADLRPFAAMGSRFGLSVTSGLRPGSVTSSGNASYHGSGDAIDMGGSSSGMLAFFKQMRANFGGRLAELIHTPGGVGIKDGRPYSYGGQVAADHFDHVHLAFTGDGIGRRRGDGIGQAVQAARSVGLRGSQLETMVAIAGAESGYNAGINAAGPEDSRGLWQINVGPGANTDMLRLGNLYNPMINAKAMKAILGRQGLNAWSVYSSGKYRAYLGQARAAIARTSGGGGRAVTPGKGGGTQQTQGYVPRSSPFFGMVQGFRQGTSGSLGYEGDLARVGVSKARAEAKNNLPSLIKALVAERGIKRKRLKWITKVLKGRINKARRVRLLQEQAELIGEIGDLSETIREYKADAAGGATTISRAEELDAGVDTSAGGGDVGGGEGGGADPNVAILAGLMAEQVANQRKLIYLAEHQAHTVVGAVVAAVNGSIGGRVGLGFQTPGYAGQMARY